LTIGQPRQAEAAQRESLSQFQEIAAADPQNAEAQRDVGVAHLRMAATLSMERREASAAAERNKALGIYESLLRRDPKNRDDIDADLGIQIDMAHYLAGKGDAAGALAHCRRGLELLATAPDSPGSVWLALSYGALGDALAHFDRPQAAVCYRKAAIIWTRLRDSGNLPDAYRDKPAALQQAAANPTEPRQ
jgi:tetratricopeptide (TPR) repeat protein